MLDSRNDPLDANRWLYVHQGEVVGAARATAVELVIEAGLLPQVVLYRDRAAGSRVMQPDRVRLLIGDDGKVRAAQSS